MFLLTTSHTHWENQTTTIQHVGLPGFVIEVLPTSFQADSRSVNSPQTTGVSDKIIFRTITIIVASLRLSKGKSQVKIQPNYSVV